MGRWDDAYVTCHMSLHAIPCHNLQGAPVKEHGTTTLQEDNFFLGGSIDFETKPFWTTMICSNYSQPRIPIVSRLLLSLLVHVGAMTYHRPEFVEMDQLLKACSLDAGERDSNRHNF